MNNEQIQLEECAAGCSYSTDEGLVWIADDFDDPLPELEEFFK